MSQSACFNQWPLEDRSMHSRPGVRKAAKRNLNRFDRHQAHAQVLRDLQAHAQVLRDLQAHAKAVAQADEPYVEPEYTWDRAFERLNAHIDADFEVEVPLVLEGSLPDWVLAQIEDKGRSSFDDLELFESPSRARRAHLFDD